MLFKDKKEAFKIITPCIPNNRAAVTRFVLLKSTKKAGQREMRVQVMQVESLGSISSHA